MKKLALSLVLFLAATTLSAQVLSRVRTHSQLGTCSKDGAVVIINDALTAGTCAAGGTSLAACWCDLSTTSWVSQPVPAATLAAYVPVTKEGQQTITASGDGNDVTLVAADDVILTPGSDFKVNLPADVSGGLTINGGADGVGGFDIFGNNGQLSIYAYDADKFSSVVVNSNGINISGAATTYVKMITGGGAFVQVTDTDASVGATTFSVDAADGADELAVAEGTVTIAGKLSATETTGSYTSSVATLTGADSATSTLSATDGISTASVSAGVDEGEPIFSFSAGSSVLAAGATGIRVVGNFRIIPSATPPVACDGGSEGSLYIDSDTHLFCGCNGTAWVQVADGTTGCS